MLLERTQPSDELLSDLLNLRNLLSDDNNWTKCNYWLDNSYCLVGAAENVLGYEMYGHPLEVSSSVNYKRLMKILAKLAQLIPGAHYTTSSGDLFIDVDVVMNWNDEPTRTHAEILELIDNAIISYMDASKVKTNATAIV